MPSVQINIDITGYVEQVDQARNKDIPFVTAKALTRTAQDGQIEMQRQVARLFTLRNSWTQRGIRITPAQKLSWPIQSEVYTDTANSKTGAPDYLVRQDDGGEKVPHAGGGHIAIPTKYLRAVAPGVIPDALRPRALLPEDAGLNTVYQGRFDATSSGARFQRVSARSLKALGSREFAAFLRYDRGGVLCLFVRPGGQRDPLPFYVLVASATVRPVLQMEEVVGKIAEDRFETHWDDAWDALG